MTMREMKEETYRVVCAEPSHHQELMFARLVPPRIYLWVDEVHVCSIFGSNQNRVQWPSRSLWLDEVHVCSIAQSNKKRIH